MTNEEVQPIENQEVSQELPEYIPEKFRSAEDPYAAMAASYTELEKKLHSQAPQKIEDKPKEEPQAEPEETKAPEYIDFRKYESEYQQEGGLSEDSYKELEGRGFRPEDIDQMINLRVQAVEQEAQKLYQSIEGGKDTYDAAIAWAAENFDEAQKSQFNTAIDSGSYLREVAVKDLISRWQADGAKLPPKESAGPIKQAASASKVTEKYQSIDEMHRDMRSRQYKTSEDYRQHVEAKARASGFF